MHGISADEIRHLYASSAVAIVPSEYEGFGLPAGEAMACGVPLVSTDGGALPEVVGDAGLLVPVRDSGALQLAIAKLLGQPAAARTLRSRWPRSASCSGFPGSSAAADMTVLYQRSWCMEYSEMSLETVDFRRCNSPPVIGCSISAAEKDATPSPPTCRRLCPRDRSRSFRQRIWPLPHEPDFENSPTERRRSPARCQFLQASGLTAAVRRRHFRQGDLLGSPRTHSRLSGQCCGKSVAC